MNRVIFRAIARAAWLLPVLVFWFGGCVGDPGRTGYLLTVLWPEGAAVPADRLDVVGYRDSGVGLERQEIVLDPLAQRKMGLVTTIFVSISGPEDEERRFHVRAFHEGTSLGEAVTTVAPPASGQIRDVSLKLGSLMPDVDGDDVPDAIDVCPGEFNPSQTPGCGSRIPTGRDSAAAGEDGRDPGDLGPRDADGGGPEQPDRVDGGDAARDPERPDAVDVQPPVEDLLPLDTEMVFGPVADTYVRGGQYAAEINGATPAFQVSGDLNRDEPARVRITYLTFELPRVREVGRAVLRLTGNLFPGTGSLAIETRRLPDPGWNERDVTWDTRPSLGTTVGFPHVVPQVVNMATFEIDLDVTALMNEGLKEARYRIGVGLASRGGSAEMARFHSRESGVGRPKLTLSPAR